MRYEPKPYMERAITFLIERACAGLFLDPGLGKTGITYAAITLLKKRRLLQRALVVAPLRPAVSVWPQEARKWDQFNGLRVVVLHGGKKDKLLRQPADVNVVNPEGLKWLLEQARSLDEWPWDMLVIDESSKFKHSRSLRFKLLKPWLRKFRRRIILTGTPAPNGLLDLFGQIYILDQGNALGAYITQYRMKYFFSTGYGGYTWVPLEHAEEQIYERLRPLVLRMSSDDYLKLPPLITNTVSLELPSAVQKQYDQLKKQLITEIDNKLITAKNAGVASMRCRQLANGGLYTSPDCSTWAHVHDVKTEAAQDLVEELGGKPVMIAYEFKHDLDRLQRAFPEALHLGGGVSPKRGLEIEALWNTGKIPVLLVQPQSAAHGLNLQDAGDALIWYSLVWDLEIYQQLIKRLHRQGRTKRVVVHHLVMRGTVDEAMMTALGSKDRTQRALLDALREQLLAPATSARLVKK